MNIIIKKVVLNEEMMQTLIDLSFDWVEESICYGMVPNEADEFSGKEVYVGYDKDKIVGYLFGHVYQTEKAISAIGKDQNVFEVDELYVVAAYRSKGIGKRLFTFAEDDLKDKVDYMTLTTSNMDAKRILRFYIEELGMNFWSARFFKNINNKDS